MFVSSRDNAVKYGRPTDVGVSFGYSIVHGVVASQVAAPLLCGRDFTVVRILSVGCFVGVCRFVAHSKDFSDLGLVRRYLPVFVPGYGIDRGVANNDLVGSSCVF